jgi:hypothetical protein
VWRWLAVASFAAALASTVVFNVPINLATGRWDAEHPLLTGSRPATGGVLPGRPLLAAAPRLRAGRRRIRHQREELVATSGTKRCSHRLLARQS